MATKFVTIRHPPRTDRDDARPTHPRSHESVAEVIRALRRD